MVSRGACLLEDWVVNEKITVARNKNDWNDKQTMINKVT